MQLTPGHRDFSALCAWGGVVTPAACVGFEVKGTRQLLRNIYFSCSGRSVEKRSIDILAVFHRVRADVDIQRSLFFREGVDSRFRWGDCVFKQRRGIGSSNSDYSPTLFLFARPKVHSVSYTRFAPSAVGLRARL